MNLQNVNIQNGLEGLLRLFLCKMVKYWMWTWCSGIPPFRTWSCRTCRRRAPASGGSWPRWRRSSRRSSAAKYSLPWVWMNYMSPKQIDKSLCWLKIEYLCSTTTHTPFEKPHIWSTRICSICVALLTFFGEHIFSETWIFRIWGWHWSSSPSLTGS